MNECAGCDITLTLTAIRLTGISQLWSVTTFHYETLLRERECICSFLISVGKYKTLTSAAFQWKSGRDWRDIYYLSAVSADRYLSHIASYELWADIVDSSGLRIYYTSSLRQSDTDNLVIGTVDGIFVPPNVDEFRVVSYCHSSCTQQVSSLICIIRLVDVLELWLQCSMSRSLVLLVFTLPEDRIEFWYS